MFDEKDHLHFFRFTVVTQDRSTEDAVIRSTDLRGEEEVRSAIEETKSSLFESEV
jgi:hypothetical protein